jgi:hypothetical protein
VPAKIKTRTMIKIFYSVVLLFLVNTGCAQNVICVCCTYSSLEYEEDFERIFNPLVIKSNEIKELTVYTTSMQTTGKPGDTAFNIVDKEYKEMMFTFDTAGNVVAKIFFNRLGQFHSVHDFTRDRNNRVLTKTYHGLDSTGKKREEDFFVKKWIYKYSNGKLRQIKKLDDKLTEQPDNTSTYEMFEYDSKGRTVKETTQRYYSGSAPSINHTAVKYDDNKHTSSAITKRKSKPVFASEIQYNTGNKPLHVKFYNGISKKPEGEHIFVYKENGQLLKFKSLGMGSECPEGGNLTDEYTYSALNLISNIRHQYKNIICDLRFVYR